MAYQVTFTLSPAYTGTTVADDFTIIGNPGNVTIATAVSKTDLTNGVTYTVDDTITGGTVTSTGVCTNSVAWTGWAGPIESVGPSEPVGPTATPIPPTPTPDAAATCFEWLIDYPGSLGDPSGSVAYIDCNGVQQNDTVQADTSSTICAQQILDYSLIQQPTNNGLCAQP